jgi:hypothetical protein
MFLQIRNISRRASPVQQSGRDNRHAKFGRE